MKYTPIRPSMTSAEVYQWMKKNSAQLPREIKHLENWAVGMESTGDISQKVDPASIGSIIYLSMFDGPVTDEKIKTITAVSNLLHRFTDFSEIQTISLLVAMVAMDNDKRIDLIEKGNIPADQLDDMYHEFLHKVAEYQIAVEDPEPVVHEVKDRIDFLAMIKNLSNTELPPKNDTSSNEHGTYYEKDVQLLYRHCLDILQNDLLKYGFYRFVHYYWMNHERNGLEVQLERLIQKYRQVIPNARDIVYRMDLILTNHGLSSMELDDLARDIFHKANAVGKGQALFSLIRTMQNLQIYNSRNDDSQLAYSSDEQKKIFKHLLYRENFLEGPLNEEDAMNKVSVKSDDGEVNQNLTLSGILDYEEVLTSADHPLSTLANITNEAYLEAEEEIATEALHKDSVAMNAAERKIYKAYRAYKDSEEKVDSQITKALSAMKKCLIGDVRSEVIEGKKFSPIGFMKQILAGVGLFSVAPVKAVMFFIIRYALKKKTSVSERRKILMELDTELELINEKIADAKSDQNREAKYAMMRTKKELENAKNRIEFEMEASSKDLSNAKAVLNGARTVTGREGGGEI